MSAKTFKVKLTKSPIGARANHIGCVRGLGFTKLGQTRELVDTPATRGMVNTVRHLVTVVE
ncbi:MAG: 50S ribosomal protein L30 [Casimicrobiaceae bacterium]|jgi:large subunit ribosomal protein L30